MSELFHLLLLVALCAGAVVVVIGLGVMWLAEQPRLGRVFRAGLDGATPDAAVIAHGTGKGAAMSLGAGLIVTAWDRGAWRLTYPLDALIGAEIDIDGEVAARVMRGETRRLLNRPGAAQREVRLRLMFDDPRHPDFELVLWPCAKTKTGPQIPREAVSEANRWVARAEAILKRTGPGALRAAPPQVRTRTPHAAAPTDDLDEGGLFDFGDEPDRDAQHDDAEDDDVLAE
jgi:hypothetical protein